MWLTCALAEVRRINEARCSCAWQCIGVLLVMIVPCFKSAVPHLPNIGLRDSWYSKSLNDCCRRHAYYRFKFRMFRSLDIGSYCFDRSEASARRKAIGYV
mmetsp:Transcript_99998/g.158284  ORF Transcript_99998/g.158284 Transcript_99998/m.158284 type:complete len:100 (-) Transcript_99998:113-412(-)